MCDLISIIIPTYHCSIYLKDCINSIIKQTYQNFEIIIVDDGSNEELIQSYHSFKVHYIKKNKGISYARNVGIKNAKGKYITFIDSDDEISPEHLENLLDHFTENIGMSIVSYSENKKYQYSSISNVIDQYSAYQIILNRKIGGYVWNKLFLRKIINDYKLMFDEKISVGEDFLFVCEYLKFIDNAYVNYNKTYFYRRHKKQITKSYDERLVTVLDSWKMIINIYMNFCPSEVSEIKYRYYKKAIELNQLNEKINYKIFNFKEKFVIIMYKIFRRQILFVKRWF